MSAELICTCGDGGQSTGNRQEVIEKRMAPIFGLTIQEIHLLLDLLTDVLDEILGISDRTVEDDLTERTMAERSGREVGWIDNFLTAWEKISDDLDGVEWWNLPEITREKATGA